MNPIRQLHKLSALIMTHLSCHSCTPSIKVNLTSELLPRLFELNDEVHDLAPGLSARVHDSLCALRDMPIEYFMERASLIIYDIYEATKIETLIDKVYGSAESSD